MLEGAQCVEEFVAAWDGRQRGEQSGRRWGVSADEHSVIALRPLIQRQPGSRRECCSTCLWRARASCRAPSVEELRRFCGTGRIRILRSEEHTSELQSREN